MGNRSYRMMWRVLQHEQTLSDDYTAKETEGITLSPVSSDPMDFAQMKILVAELVSQKYNVQEMQIERIANQTSDGSFTLNKKDIQGINDNAEKIFQTLETVQSEVLSLYESAKKTAALPKRERLAIIAVLRSYDPMLPIQFQILGYICS